MTDTVATRPVSDPVEAVLAAFTRPRRRPATEEETLPLASAVRETVQHRGAALAAWQWGEGKPVLLLHGWESRASHMAAFIPGLLKAGFSAVALDAPAHGDSEGDETNVVDYGLAVATAAARFGPLAGVIAHSVGSAAALHACAHGVSVPASVHLCGPASLKRVLRVTGAAAGLDAAGLARLEWLMTERLGMSLDVMELHALKRGLVHPALILHDPQDREVPAAESAALAAAWPRAALEPVEGVGHRRILRDPGVVSQAVAFIASA